MQVIIEDYANQEWVKVGAILAIKAICWLLAHRLGARGPADRGLRRIGIRTMNAITSPSRGAYRIVDHTYDVVVVGAGGAGLRATFGMAEAGLKTACITKVFPTRSHTVAAQGGISAALGNMGDGRLALAHVRHRQGVGLAGRPGRDRVHVPRGARRRSIELEHYGVPFSRTEDGRDLPAPLRRHDHRLRQGRRRSAPAPPPTAPATPSCTRCTSSR